MTDDRLPCLVSFSGGRTSGMMSYLLSKFHREEYDLRFVFANTGQEDEATLRFVDRCDKEFGLGVVWVEAVFNETLGKGNGFRVVDYETATRDGSLFEAHAQKYGLPNPAHIGCTRTLKLEPIKSWAESIGWAKQSHYYTALGIRSDEKRRAKQQPGLRLIYPLIDPYDMDVHDVAEFWQSMPFDLEIPGPHRGNCLWCYKKSLKKLVQVAKETPEAFEVPKRLEETYPRVGAEFRKDPTARDRKIFRNYMTAQSILDLAAETAVPETGLDWTSETTLCSESCEVYEMEDE